MTADDTADDYTSTVDDDWKVTIPPEARQHLNLHPGDTVTFFVERPGSILLRISRYPTVASFAGAAGTLSQPMEFEEMLEIAREDAATLQRSCGEDDLAPEEPRPRR